LTPETMLVVDYDGKVLEGEGQPPSELPIHIEILRAQPGRPVGCSILIWNSQSRLP